MNLPDSFSWCPGRPVEPVSVRRLRALHPPALSAEVDQRARLLDLRALLLPLPGHRHQHEEAVAGSCHAFTLHPSLHGHPFHSTVTTEQAALHMTLLKHRRGRTPEQTH